MAKNYTPVPDEFLEEMGELGDAEYGRLIRWCQTYNITGEELELNGNERFYKARCKNYIDRAHELYEELCEKNRENGAKGGRPKKPKITQQNPQKPTKTQNNPTVFPETQQNPKKPKKPNKTETETKTQTEKEKEGRSPSKEKDAVIEAWNSLEGIPKITDIKTGTQRSEWLKSRLEDYSLEEILAAIENVKNSRFLLGDNDKKWRITFDWFIRPNNFVKVLEGNYSDAPKKEPLKTTEYTREDFLRMQEERERRELEEAEDVDPEKLKRIAEMQELVRRSISANQR